MTVARTVLDGYAAPITQLTLARFIDGGHFGAHVRAMRAVYAERLGTLASLVERHLSSFLEARVPIGGLQMPCLLTCDVSERAIIDAAQRNGIKLFGTSALFAGGKGTPGFLLGFAAYTPHEIELSVKKLANVFHSLTSKQALS
jgi:GntR family transcriptional regulator/MocR family aminotransferase